MLTFRRATVLFFVILGAVNVTSILPENLVSDAIRPSRMVITLGLAAGYLGLSFGMAFLPCSGYHFPTICRGNTAAKKVALTFDDGPDPHFTPMILDTLQRRDIAATFFCTGYKIAENEAILQRMVSENHLIGNHSFSHSHWFGWYPAKKIIKEIEATDQVIHVATGLKPLWFRPPFGVINPMISRALKKCGHQAICWNIRSLDTMGGPPARITERIVKRLRPGSIILLHDHSRYTRNNLGALLDRIKAAGFVVAPLDEILERKSYA